MKPFPLLLSILTLIACRAHAQTLPAAQPATPQKPILHIDTQKPITHAFLGFGVELDPMALNANNRRRGVTDDDWKLLTARLADMRMPITRVMVQLSWFYKTKDAPFDYENPQAKSALAYLDFCQKEKIDVILTDWAWSNECKWIQGRQDPAFGAGVATYLKYFLEEKKYTCIKYLVIGNEPDNEIKDLAVYSAMVHNVHDALKAAGLRDKIKLMGPDTADAGDWFDKAAAKIADVVDAYDFHRYPSPSDISDNGQKKLNEILARYRPAVDKIDPKGKDKPILMTEMGLGGGATFSNKLIDTPEYALHMADYAIGVLNSGAKTGIAWCAFDIYYFEGESLMTWGMWKFKDDNWAPKPWHAVWQSVTSSIPAGADVLPVTGTIPTLHAAALAIRAPAISPAKPAAYSGVILLLSNRSAQSQPVSLPNPLAGAAHWSSVTHTPPTVQKSTSTDLPMPDSAIDLALPANSFTIISIDQSDK